MEYVKTTDKAEEDQKREALVEELKKIDAELKKSDGPYVGGQDVNAVDLKLGPQLKHVIIGSKAVKARSLPFRCCLTDDILMPCPLLAACKMGPHLKHVIIGSKSVKVCSLPFMIEMLLY